MSNLLSGMVLAVCGWLIAVLMSWRVMGNPLEHAVLFTVFSIIFIVGMTAVLMLRPYKCEVQRSPGLADPGCSILGFSFFSPILLPFLMLYGAGAALDGKKEPASEPVRPKVPFGSKFRKSIGKASSVSLAVWLITNLGAIDLLDKLFEKYKWEAVTWYAAGNVVFFVVGIGVLILVFWPRKEEAA